MTTENDIRTTLQDIRDPEIGRGLGELKMLGDISVADDGGVSVTVVLPTPAYPQRERIGEALSAAIAETHPDAGPVDVTYDWRRLVTASPHLPTNSSGRLRQSSRVSPQLLLGMQFRLWY